MKAAIWTRFGSPDVLKIKEVEKPVPQDNEVLIELHASSVAAGDVEMRSLIPMTWLKVALRIYMLMRRPKQPIVLGQELAGVIEAVGADVTKFKVGDEVFAAVDFNLGTYLEYKCLSEDAIMVIKPANISFAEAAAIPIGGLTSLHFLQQGQVGEGTKILIHGAGGSIGTFAIQLAKHFGAEVTALDRTEKLDMMRAIGADHVIDHTREDFTKMGVQYDVIFDVAGKSPFFGSLRALKDNGVYLIDNPTLFQTMAKAWTGRGRKVISHQPGTSTNAKNIVYLKELMEAGTIKSVIDKTFPLEQAAAAHRYVETGLKQGHVLLTMGE